MQYTASIHKRTHINNANGSLIRLMTTVLCYILNIRATILMLIYMILVLDLSQSSDEGSWVTKKLTCEEILQLYLWLHYHRGLDYYSSSLNTIP